MKTTKYFAALVSVATALTFTACTQDQENLAVASAGVAAVAVATSNYHEDGSHTGNYYHNN